MSFSSINSIVNSTHIVKHNKCSSKPRTVILMNIGLYMSAFRTCIIIIFVLFDHNFRSCRCRRLFFFCHYIVIVSFFDFILYRDLYFKQNLFPSCTDFDYAVFVFLFFSFYFMNEDKALPPTLVTK